MENYPIEQTSDDNGTILITFPDLPEAAAIAEKPEDVPAAARAALAAVAVQYLRRGLDLPAARPAEGRPTVRLTALARAKLALARALHEQAVTQAALGARLDIDARQVRRLLDPTVSSRFEDVERALEALDFDLICEARRKAA